MNGQPPWLAEAWRELGQTEIAGARDNPRITAFFKELGHEAHARDEVAWCAAFVGACLERSDQASTRSLMARSYSGFGEPLPTERTGAIAVLTRGRNPAFGHVGFLVGWSAERLWLLGGNQGNAVSVAGFDRSRLVALRWPVVQTPGIFETNPDVFAVALEHVLAMEGGYTNDPHDPGGPTNKGITLSTLAAWRKEKITEKSKPAMIAELRNISSEIVTAIYAKRYWAPAGCHEMPQAIAFFHFDAAVNHGVTGAIRMLQEATGAAVDGEMGPETRGKVAAMPIAELLQRYAAIRRRKYRALPHFWRFGRGWLNRVERTLQRTSEFPSEKTGPTKTMTPNRQQSGDATMNENEQQSSKWWGQSMTIWGALVTAAAVVLPSVGTVLGLELDADMVRLLGEQILSVIQTITALAGTAMTIYGRSRAVLPLARRSITLKV
ncbi:MAG: TIGR02594 family protein [Alphaproteobacteria bacterium]|nr:TIGR02594 family protein [Alphaproteobacteria bacterium]